VMMRPPGFVAQPEKFSDTGLETSVVMFPVIGHIERQC